MRTRVMVLRAMVCFHVFGWLLVTSAQAGDADTDDVELGMKIACRDLRITDKMLELRYEIENGSERDVWICEGIHVGGSAFEVYLESDDHTLLIRRRFDIRSEVVWAVAPTGRYARLRAGEKRRENLIMPVPIHAQSIFTSIGAGQHVTNASRLILEIGFYEGDLYRRVLDSFEERQAAQKSMDPPFKAQGYVVPGLTFTVANEESTNRDEHILIPYTGDAPEGGRSVELLIEGQRIPYARKWQDPRPYFPAPDLNGCTRVEVHFEPSALEYLFPHANEQSLLSSSEKAAILAASVIQTSDPDRIRAFAEEVGMAGYIADGVMIAEGRMARLTCYRGDQQMASFILHGDDTVFEVNGLWFDCVPSLTSYRRLSPHLDQFDLRMQCASNLKNLWYRFRLYHNSQNVDLDAEGDLTYPAFATWSDELLVAYKQAGPQSQIVKPFICPSADPGRCHYAMNPYCEPNSPADTVLLFESEPGWNQEGGPELFTFDNHDPRGGLVLLNDGTVKFIRTEEELKALRWK